jgi:hypothetical protein
LFYFFGSTSRIKKQIFYECQVLGVTTAIKVSGERKKNKKQTGYDRKPQTFFFSFSLSVDYRIVSALAPSVRIVTRQKRMSEEFLRALLGGLLDGSFNNHFFPFGQVVVAGPLFDLSSNCAAEAEGSGCCLCAVNRSHLTILFWFLWPMFHFERAMKRGHGIFQLCKNNRDPLANCVISNVDVKEEIRQVGG